MRFMHFVNPGLTKPPPDLIRGNPVRSRVPPDEPGDGAWIPAGFYLSLPVLDTGYSDTGRERGPLF
jgi:hypothetical protein